MDNYRALTRYGSMTEGIHKTSAVGQTVCERRSDQSLYRQPLDSARYRCGFGRIKPSIYRRSGGCDF